MRSSLQVPRYDLPYDTDRLVTCVDQFGVVDFDDLMITVRSKRMKVRVPREVVTHIPMIFISPSGVVSHAAYRLSDIDVFGKGECFSVIYASGRT
jgi:hypothetical protein